VLKEISISYERLDAEPVRVHEDVLPIVAIYVVPPREVVSVLRVDVRGVDAAVLLRCSEHCRQDFDHRELRVDPRPPPVAAGKKRTGRAVSPSMNLEKSRADRVRPSTLDEREFVVVVLEGMLGDEKVDE